MNALRRAAALSVLFVACAAPPPASPTAKSRAVSATDLLPNDLDFVVRIDSGRVRNSPIFTGAFRTLAAGSSSGILPTVLPALSASRSLFLGGRLMSDGYRGDGVVAIELDGALEGGGAEGAVADPPFQRAIDYVPGVELFERAPRLRGDAALKVVLARGLVLATAAEVDAVMRVLRSGPDVDRLDPPAHGLASFAGRILSARAGEPPPSSRLQKLAAGLSRFSGTIEAAEGFQVDVDLLYDSAESAEKASAAARTLLEPLSGLGADYRALIDSAKLDRSAEGLRVRATVPFALVASVH